MLQRAKHPGPLSLGERSAATLQSDVMGQCLEQYSAVEPSAHHRVARRFLDPCHPEGLRSEIDAMLADGTQMSAKLALAVSALAWVPLDDCICEGAHAQAKRLKTPASAAKWAWVASSMRLAQNLEDCERLPDETSLSLEAAWSAYATVVQPPSKSQVVPRLNPAKLQRRIYRVDHLVGFKVGRQPHRLALCDASVVDTPAAAIADAGEPSNSRPDNPNPLADQDQRSRSTSVRECRATSSSS